MTNVGAVAVKRLKSQLVSSGLTALWWRCIGFPGAHFLETRGACEVEYGIAPDEIVEPVDLAILCRAHSFAGYSRFHAWGLNDEIMFIDTEIDKLVVDNRDLARGQNAVVHFYLRA